MPFDPNLPQPGQQTDANLVRAQFNGLKELIDAVPVAPPALALDQSTPQQVTGGAPVFAGGVQVGANGEARLDAVSVPGNMTFGQLVLKTVEGAEQTLTADDVAGIHAPKPEALVLDQSQGPQTVTGGRPVFEQGITGEVE